MCALQTEVNACNIQYSNHTTLIPLKLYQKTQEHTRKHILYRSHLYLRKRGKGQMCIRTQLLLKTTKEGLLIGQMGSFFYLHALAGISITTEDHSCESSLVSSPNAHTSKIHSGTVIHSRTWEYAAVHNFMTLWFGSLSSLCAVCTVSLFL